MKLSRREALTWITGAAIGGVSGLTFAASGYEEVQPPQPTASDGKIEVMEFFWYGCPHCYQFHPVVEDWRKTIADDVDFRLMPGVLNPSWVNHARAYFAAEAMGEVDKIHDSLFDALHKHKKRIIKMEDLADFAGEQGIDRAKFLSTMKSFTVETNLRRSQQLARAYKIRGVPTVTVAGKYITSGSLAGSYPRVIQVINQLIERERNAS
ncbi:MAG: thiol:disulfide interchange protein DsbA/DsbL [Pseudomonadota bacterium]